MWACIQAVFEAHGRHRGTDIDAALGFVARTQRRRAVLLVVSDFLDPGPWPDAIARLTRKHEVHAIVVHDPLDSSLRGMGLTEVVDAETGRVQLVDAGRWLAKESTDQRVRTLLSKGARAVALSTEDDPYQVLHRHFQSAGRRR
ncbi:MAG: hypothetical protein ACI9MC_003607 [Kiritimatiellia bacterium]